MNDDCILLVLEQLNFVDLLNAAQTNKQISLTAVYVFKQKYSNHEFVVTDDFVFPVEQKSFGLINVVGIEINLETIKKTLEWIGFGGKEEDEAVNSSIKNEKLIESDASIEIIDYKLLMNTFKCFGNSISKLKYTYEPMRHLQAQHLAQLISNHSSESLVEISFDYCTEDMMKHLTKPLVNVHTVTFEGSFTVSDSALSIDKLFPSIQRLNLDIYYTDTTEYFNCFMPHLEHLRWRGGVFLDDQFRRHHMPSIANNPRIRSIEFHKTTPVHIQALQSMLPNLEN